MRNLSASELAAIEQRADLWFRFGDATALRPEDVADLIAEVRDLHQLRASLTARYRQQLDQLTELKDEMYAERFTAEVDPP